MNYQLIKEDDKAFHIKHPDGTSFRVAKKGLSKEGIKRIQKLPHFDDGGFVQADMAAQTPDPSSINPQFGFTPDANAPGLDTLANALTAHPPAEQSAQTNQEAANLAQEMENSGHVVMPEDKSETPQSQPQSSEPVQASANQGSQGEVNPAAFNMYGGIEGAYNEGVSGLNEMAKAQSEQAKADQQAWGNYQNQQAQFQQQFQEQQNQLKAENDKLTQAVASSQINPNHYWQNMSTANKIGTAVSLFLGGLGAGMAKTPNYAMQMFQKNVDNDIAAQRQNLGKTQNLLSMNLAKYRNLYAAEDATRLQYFSMLKGQLAMNAAKSGSEMAMARAKMGIAAIDQQMAPIQMKLSMMQLQAKSLNGGIPVGQDTALQVLNPGYNPLRVVVNGIAYQAPDAKTAEQLRNVEALAGPVISDIRQLDKLGPEATIPGSAAWNTAHALRGRLATALPMLSGAQVGVSRINEAEINHLLETIKDPTKFTQLLHGGLRNNETIRNLENEIESQRVNKLSGYKPYGGVQFQPAPGPLPLNGNTK